MTTATRTKPVPNSRQVNEIARIARRYGRYEWAMYSDGRILLTLLGDHDDSTPVHLTLDHNGTVISRCGPARISALPEDED